MSNANRHQDAWSGFDRALLDFEYLDWRFEINRSLWYPHEQPPQLRIQFVTEDSEGKVPGPRLFAHGFILPYPEMMNDPPWDDAAHFQYLIDRVLDVVRHEAMENVKVKGEQIVFPHHQHGTSYQEKLISNHPRVADYRRAGRGY